VEIPSQQSVTPLLDSPSLSLRKGLGELVTKDESEAFEISPKEGSDASAFSEAPEPISEPEPPAEVDYASGAVAQPVDDDWGILMPVRSAKKTKKGKKGL
jgi:hypothetical protein